MFAVQHALGLPSRSDWYRKCLGTLPQLVACPNLAYLERALKHNLQQQFATYNGPKCAWSVTVDEMACSQRATWCQLFNATLGCCFEHTTGADVDASSVENLRELKAKINAGMRPCHSPWRFTSRPESCPASEPPVPPPQGQCTVTKATGKPRRPTSSRSSRTPTATTPAAPSSCSPLASRALPGRIQSQGTIRLMTPLQAVAEPKLDLGPL